MAKPKEPLSLKNVSPEAHGVKRPRFGTLTAAVWEIADELSKKFGRPATRQEVIEKAVAKGSNAFTASSQYRAWAVHYGLGKEQRMGKGLNIKPAILPAKKVEAAKKPAKKPAAPGKMPGKKKPACIDNDAAVLAA